METSIRLTAISLPPPQTHETALLANYHPEPYREEAIEICGSQCEQIAMEQSSLLLHLYALLVTQFRTTERCAFYTESTTKTLTLLERNRRIPL